MTLRQKQLLKKLPENNFNVSKTAKEVGYSEHYSTSGSLYQTLRNSANCKDYFDEDYIKKEYKRTLKECRKAKDLTNKLRTLEGMARIKSMFTDKNESNITVSDEKRADLLNLSRRISLNDNTLPSEKQ